jgi:hypothetical protein
VTDRLVFNGIDGDTGDYLLSPMTPEELSRLALGESLDSDHQRELEDRRLGAEPHLGLKAGLDARDLAQAGWGVVFAHDADPAVREALSELLDLRRRQAGRLYREYAGADGVQAGESKNAFLARHGSGPNPVDPEKVPYYLLLVGDPEAIPYRFQYELDVQHAVGRICFVDLDDYARYARSVVEAETGQVRLPRRAVFFGVRNENDGATELSASELVQPLAERLARAPQWSVETILGEGATKARLVDVLTGGQAPPLLFTASHGMGFDKGAPRQIRHQGALLCQDWPGPLKWQAAIPEGFYLSADDIPSETRLQGLITFAFACYGAGTPRWDDFAHRAAGPRQEIAPRAFVAGLPQRLLGRNGALAWIGHVERAWGCSFVWQQAGRQITAFESTLDQLSEGYPVGAALDFFNLRYAELASMLSSELEDLHAFPGKNPLLLSEIWTAHNDARGYALFGDPAVRLPQTSTTGEPERPGLPVENPLGLPPRLSGPPPFAAAAPAPAADTSSYGLFDSLQGPRARLTDALAGFADRLGELLRGTLDDLTSLNVETYSSADMTAVKPEDLRGTARLRALTRITFDGDTQVCVPERDGEVDDELWEIHAGMVERAQAHRAKMLETVVSAVSGLLGTLKGG